MNSPLIARKLESLAHCLRRIEDKKPVRLSDLENNYDLQDIISVNLERSIQLCVDIAAIIISERDLKTSNTMAGSFKILEEAGILPDDLSVKLQKAIGFRNVSVHEYHLCIGRFRNPDFGGTISCNQGFRDSNSPSMAFFASMKRLL